MPAKAIAGTPEASRDAGLNPPPSFNFVTDVLRPQARATPERIAVIGVDPTGAIDCWSYGRVAQASGRLAGALLDAGIVKGDRILILMPRTPQWLIAMTACQHIGAIPVPCVTQISASEVTYRAKQCGARGAISSVELVGRFAGLEAGLPVRIARGVAPGWLDLRSIIDSPRDIPPTADMPAETPALMYFTSGSSGPPKAVVHAARGVFVRCWQPWIQLGNHRRRRDLDHQRHRLDPRRQLSVVRRVDAWRDLAHRRAQPFRRRKVEMLARHGVTIYGAVATELRQIIAGAAPRALPKLRCTISAGEALTAELSHRWTAFSGARWWWATDRPKPRPRR